VDGVVGAVTDRNDDTTAVPPDLDDQIGTRAHDPLPEEVTAGDDGDRTDEVAEILRESEERMAEAVAGDAPGDAADESRHSDETL
jgi:hypothetical protein